MTQIGLKAIDPCLLLSSMHGFDPTRLTYMDLQAIGHFPGAVNENCPGMRHLAGYSHLCWHLAKEEQVLIDAFQAPQPRRTSALRTLTC